MAHALGMLLEGAAPGSASHAQLQEVVFGLAGGSADPEALGEAIKGLCDAVVQASLF